MNIEISTKEYRELLDILHIADRIISGHRKEEDNRTRSHHALIRKLYALAPAEGVEPVAYNENMNRYLAPEEFENTTLAHVLIHEFEDHMFWDQLIFRLTQRDAVQMAGGIPQLSAMSDIDRQRMEETIRQKYIAEFSANGVANLEVIETFGAGKGTLVETSD